MLIEPNSAAWFEARRGAITASRAPALMRRQKDGKPYAVYETTIAELAVERLTDVNVSHFVTDAMMRGRELEPDALDAYALEFMVPLGASEYVMHPKLPRVGCTPDAFVGDDGLVQAKCPNNSMKHFKFLKDKKNSTLFKEYEHQLVFEMFVTGRQWNDLASYDPRYPPHLQLGVVRVERDEQQMAEVAAIIEQVELDIAEIQKELESLTP